MFIGLVTLQVHAQTLSPLTEDQDGDGNPLNEEEEISFDCWRDQDLVKDLATKFGVEQMVGLTLDKDNCNFVNSQQKTRSAVPGHRHRHVW